MKKPKLLAFFLCIGILSHPLCAFAKEGLSWIIISDESREDDSDEDDKDDSDGNEEDEDSEEDSEDDDADEDSEDEDADKDDKDDKTDASDKSKYPSENIYSVSETEQMILEKYRELIKAYTIKDKFKKTKEIDRIDSFILNFSGDPLKGKKIAFLGDSITAGNGGTLTPDGSGMDYTDFISNYTSAEIINLGIGGTPFDGGDNDDALVHRYRDIPDDTDIIVLFGGINDLFAGADHFGSPDNPEKGTYCGDVYETFEQIHDLYPDTEVYVVITYPNKMQEYEEYLEDDWQDYADVQIEFAKEFDFRVIDLYKEGFMDSSDAKIRNAFFKDDIHPDDLGSEILGRHILVHLIKDHV